MVKETAPKETLKLLRHCRSLFRAHPSLRCCARRLASSNRLVVLAGCSSGLADGDTPTTGPAACAGAVSFLSGMMTTGFCGLNNSGLGGADGADLWRAVARLLPTVDSFY